MAHVHPPIVLSHPDERDSKENHDAKDLVVEYIKSHLPGIDTKLNIEEPCMSTVSTWIAKYLWIFGKHQDAYVIDSWLPGKWWKRKTNLAQLTHSTLWHLIHRSNEWIDLERSALGCYFFFSIIFLSYHFRLLQMGIISLTTTPSTRTS